MLLLSIMQEGNIVLTYEKGRLAISKSQIRREMRRKERVDYLGIL
jgi:nicotinic acid mononucleotide adenylyltransferase